MPHFKSETKLVRYGMLILISVLLLLAVALLVIAIHRHIISNKYNALIVKYSRWYSVDPNLIKAVIWRESNFNAETKGSKGEIGLMQILPSASVHDWAAYNRRPIPHNGLLLSPDININIGTWYLAKCANRWIKYKNCLALALAEYNAGYTNVKRWLPSNCDDDVINRINFPSTKNYVIDILSRYEKYKKSKENLNMVIDH
jgi:soluble lytic murein transglycosylase